MASSTNLEDRFNQAVEIIQYLPVDGAFRPSHSTKLTFYGLYKQATRGPCQESQPSIFNYIGRAKWEAWDRYRAMTKEQAMLEYIDELRKIIQAIPQTSALSEFSQLIGLSEQSRGNESVACQPRTSEAFVNRTVDDDHNEYTFVGASNPIHTLGSTRNSPTSSSSSTSTSSSRLSSDVDEFYEDPSDFLFLHHDDITSNSNSEQQSISTTRMPHSSSEVSTGRNASNISRRYPTRDETSHSYVSSVRYRRLSVASNDHYVPENYNRETQRAILKALTKLQRDIHNILMRLNRLETVAYFLQQKELSLSSELDAWSRWSPLLGFRRGAIVFIFLWPFIAFVLIRLIIRAKIIIRLRR